MQQVLSAYAKSKDRISIKTLTSIIENIDHKYPYHQAIGFYMTKVGYSKKDTSQLKKMGLNFDFFLDYKMIEPKYDEEWKIFYPKELL